MAAIAGQNRTPSPKSIGHGGRRRVLLCPCRSTLRNAIGRAWRETRPMTGRFYTGVHTTGIYCRPVCPVRPARSANVSFFPSAAAAEAAGFRPCLRCRPETAPFCNAWIGSRATVERALRLIIEGGALDGEGATVERLAARLGMGARHLTRLFARHVQASPLKVARTARVQRAKRLIDETSLPMTEIAMRAGFGSLRRFNSVFAKVYGRPPTEIRRKRPSGAVGAAGFERSPAMPPADGRAAG
jgi:AraC family transcriptional regulator, regulatory protein of adaptative response / methylated-DNA-[protein]-cysteine methyltransferase